MTLFYVPLESYISRYTHQWSAPKTGWLERNWIKAGVKYQRIEGQVPSQQKERSIKTGSVVDAVGRSVYCFHQITRLLDQAEMGLITNNDVIYFDDFWTPGIEALPYAFHLLGIKPKMYAFLHAQSVDEFDFTHPMRHWMRNIEKGIGDMLDGIFVCGPTLQDLVVFGGIAPREKVHVTGHPFNSEEVMERMPIWYQKLMSDAVLKNTLNDEVKRKNQVVWSSRWDEEKNPLFFLKVAADVKAVRPNIKFIVCTGAKQLRSNNPQLLTEAQAAQTNGLIEIREGLTKEQYYEILCESKIQFNCASQDFVAITLLEASVAGCYPVYPYFRSFPETLRRDPLYLYQHLDLKDARNSILSVCQWASEVFWSKEEIQRRSWIHRRFDDSWLRQLQIMEFDLPINYWNEKGCLNIESMNPYDEGVYQ